MGEYLKKVYSSVSDFVVALPPAKKFALVGTSVGIFVVLLVLFRWAGEQSYETLMTNLNAEDSANVIRILRERQVPFRVDQGGKKIQIPPERLHDLRLELAAMGLPQSGSVGYELFDKQSLGTTSYVQKVNFKRALEGELIRTIVSLRGVKRARVHLVMPKESAFVEDQKNPTASVVVDIEPGNRLNEKQIYGIQNLVAKAVEGLEVSDVVILEAGGRVLSKNTRDPLVALTADQHDFKRKVEGDFERRIVELLEPVIGEGRVVARVTAKVDFNQESQVQTLFDGDSAAVRSTKKDSQTMQGQRPGPGVAGARANQPGQNPNAPPLVTSNTTKEKELQNYAIPKTTVQKRKQLGTISKLSVAVLVDGKRVTEKGENGEILSKSQAWAPEQLIEFENIVQSAVGLDKKRGDTLQIRNMEFTREDFAEAEKILAESERRNYIQNLIVYSVIGLVIVLFFLFVVRPFIKWVTENTIDSVDSFLPQTIEELEKIQKNTGNLPGMEEIVPELPDKIDPEKVEGEMIKEKIITLVDTNPHKAALILREWVRGEKEKDKEGKPA